MDAKLYVCFMIEILGISFHEFVLRVFCGAVYLYRSDEGLTLETSAFLPFTVANLRFQPSC